MTVLRLKTKLKSPSMVSRPYWLYPTLHLSSSSASLHLTLLQQHWITYYSSNALSLVVCVSLRLLFPVQEIFPDSHSSLPILHSNICSNVPSSESFSDYILQYPSSLILYLITLFYFYSMLT